MTPKDLAAGTIAGAACLLFSVNGQTPESAEYVSLRTPKSGVVVRTVTGTTTYDPAIVTYSPGECLVRIEHDRDVIFSDGFEGR